MPRAATLTHVGVQPSTQTSDERLSLLGHRPLLPSPGPAPAYVAPGGSATQGPHSRMPGPARSSHPPLGIQLLTRVRSTYGPPRKGAGSAVCSAGLNAQHQASAFVQRTRVFFSSLSQPKPTSADNPLTTGDSVANIRNHISFRQLPPRPQLRLGAKTANRIHSFWGRMIRGPLHAPTFRNNALCVKTRTNQRKGDAA